MKRDLIYGLLIGISYIVAFFFAFLAVGMLFYTHNPLHVAIAKNHGITAVGFVVLGKFVTLMSVAQEALNIYVERHGRRTESEDDIQR